MMGKKIQKKGNDWGVESPLRKEDTPSKILKISDIRIESDKDFSYLCADIACGDIVKKV